tara:strand:- start:1647 stop:1829 length:183 start_codon:yes stop_codon:yes gene_type:complete
MMEQIENIERFLDWLKTCPVQHRISSMQGDIVHAKFDLSKPDLDDFEGHNQCLNDIERGK